MSNSYTNLPSQSDAPKKSGVNVLLIVVLSVSLLFGALICCGVLAALLLPAVQQARIAAQRINDSNNIRQIGMALLNYESTYKQFPPAYTVDADGNKLHSWRVAILPFIERNDLYQKIDFSKPWDAPENATVRNAVVDSYSSIAGNLPAGQTVFQAVVDPQGVFTGPEATRSGNITGSWSDRVLVIQAGRDHPVHWMEPSDVDLDYFTHMNPKANVYPGGTHVLFMDCTVKFLTDDVPTEVRKAMVTGSTEP